MGAILNSTAFAVSGGAKLSLPGVKSYTKSYCGPIYWTVSGVGGVLELPGLTNLSGAGCIGGDPLTAQATGGGQILLTNAVGVDGTMSITADGTGSQVILSGMTDVLLRSGYQVSFTAQNRGLVDLRRVRSISGYGCSVLSAGTGSVIDLSSLSAFATPQGASELTAKNGGVILLPGNVFLLANVAVNVAGNPVLPPVVSAGPALSLSGRAWHSYWVEVRDTRDPASPWGLFMRVPQTNEFQTFAPAPPPNTAFRVWEFVADPPIVDISRADAANVGLVLYGAPPKSFEVQTTNSLDVLPAGWAMWATTGLMTNSFRLFPLFPPTEVKGFYRAKEL